MEGSSEESVMPMKLEIDVAQHDMKKCGIKEEVKVSNIDGNKFLIKIIVEKKRGCFTQLIEAMNYLGFELSEPMSPLSVVQCFFHPVYMEKYGDTLMVEHIEELLSEMMRSMKTSSQSAIELGNTN
ncbi:transcription factor ABORTED MICROSPORES-like [Gossypium hirsutum]|uniref:Transcription factor ABORTED MICROSPORES-like n=1 Tax=Gossypium hirsutum TaxID=3635 RepID=A0ABM3AUT7_GOSHI|nr:transcription factor ABORTED MICROSPORES-like [Gossypium hirsutum]